MRKLVILMMVLALGGPVALADGGGGAPSGTGPKSAQAGKRQGTRKLARAQPHRTVAASDSAAAATGDQKADRHLGAGAACSCAPR